ncbi:MULTISPECIES: class I SAM-dependent methyltransferase [unclassified Nocardia]|uniref:class I SAM-dependent methyltransferase n=1 Tax=unclassified Nocardia TaxID=2637762 RepID=UPI001CE3D1A3|nr:MULTISPECIES: class I SAM-dependent methyltransferase [unclassified Nocardia]
MNLNDENVLAAQLISIADGVYEESAARLGEIGADAVAEAVLIEIAWRARTANPPTQPVTAVFELTYEGKQFDYLLTLGTEDPAVGPGTLADPWLVVRQDLVELLRAVYGPPDAVSATRAITLKDEPGPASFAPDDPFRVAREAASVAADQIVTACSPYHYDLNTLSLRYGSDKWGGHWYTQHYERHFEPLRNSRVRVLELGIGGYTAPNVGGASLRMWKQYFRRGLVFGLDYFDKSGIAEPRLQPLRGDQGNAPFLNELGSALGPFDIIIDDGSHISGDVITSFEALFAHLRPGGLYVVEDTQTSYWSGWGGSSTRLDDASTSIGYLKTLVDALHRQDFEQDAARESRPHDEWIGAAHFYHNLAVIEKRRNGEQSAPSWVPRHTNPMEWMKPKEGEQA